MRLLRRRAERLPTEERFLAISHGYRGLVGRDPSSAELEAFEQHLADDQSVGDQLLALASSPECLRRAIDGLDAAGSGDEDFVARCYETLLRRDADPSGLAHYVSRLRDGDSRETIAMVLAGSDEHVNHIAAEAYPLPDLIAAFPERYARAHDDSGAETAWCYVADSEAAYDWINAQISLHGYYDRPGIWSFSVNEDKRTMARIIASLQPSRVMDLGCANGTIIDCLDDLGVYAEGVDLSATAMRRASPLARTRIHVGDAVEIALPHSCDVLAGLDIFEHVPPSRVGALIRNVASMLEPGGRVVANIPAFGRDETFGEVFDVYLDEWQTAAAADEPFTHLHVDHAGFPLHGHLTWATTQWWQSQFEAAGFTRDTTNEQRIQVEFAQEFTDHPSRRSLYVFTKVAETS